MERKHFTIEFLRIVSYFVRGLNGDAVSIRHGVMISNARQLVTFLILLSGRWLWE